MNSFAGEGILTLTAKKAELTHDTSWTGMKPYLIISHSEDPKKKNKTQEREED